MKNLMIADIKKCSRHLRWQIFRCTSSKCLDTRFEIRQKLQNTFSSFFTDFLWRAEKHFCLALLVSARERAWDERYPHFPGLSHLLHYFHFVHFFIFFFFVWNGHFFKVATRRKQFKFFFSLSKSLLFYLSLSLLLSLALCLSHPDLFHCIWKFISSWHANKKVS